MSWLLTFSHRGGGDVEQPDVILDDKPGQLAVVNVVLLRRRLWRITASKRLLSRFLRATPRVLTVAKANVIEAVEVLATVTRLRGLLCGLQPSAILMSNLY